MNNLLELTTAEPVSTYTNAHSKIDFLIDENQKKQHRYGYVREIPLDAMNRFVESYKPQYLEAFNLFEHENPEAAYDSLLSNINKNRLIGYVTQKQPTDRDVKEGRVVTGRHETGDKVEFLLDMVPKATIDEYPLWDSEEGNRYKIESGERKYRDWREEPWRLLEDYRRDVAKVPTNPDTAFTWDYGAWERSSNDLKKQMANKLGTLFHETLHSNPVTKEGTYHGEVPSEKAFDVLGDYLYDNLQYVDSELYKDLLFTPPTVGVGIPYSYGRDSRNSLLYYLGALKEHEKNPNNLKDMKPMIKLMHKLNPHLIGADN